MRIGFRDAWNRFGSHESSRRSEVKGQRRSEAGRPAGPPPPFLVGRAFFVLQTGSIFSEKAGEHRGNRLCLRRLSGPGSRPPRWRRRRGMVFSSELQVRVDSATQPRSTDVSFFFFFFLIEPTRSHCCLRESGAPKIQFPPELSSLPIQRLSTSVCDGKPVIAEIFPTFLINFLASRNFHPSSFLLGWSNCYLEARKWDFWNLFRTRGIILFLNGTAVFFSVYRKGEERKERSDYNYDNSGEALRRFGKGFCA